MWHLLTITRSPHFPRYWPFVRWIHRSPLVFPHKGPATRDFKVFFDLCLNKCSHTIETPVIWDAIALNMTSLQQCFSIFDQNWMAYAPYVGNIVPGVYCSRPQSYIMILIMNQCAVILLCYLCAKLFFILFKFHWSLSLLDNETSLRKVMVCCRDITNHYLMRWPRSMVPCGIHYNDVIMGAMTSQITSLTMVYSIVYSDADKKNIKALCHWPLCWEFTGEFPLQMGSNADNGK